MGKMTLKSKIILTTLTISVLFFSGTYLAQNISATQLVKETAKTQAKLDEKIKNEIAESQMSFKKIQNMSVTNYYLSELQYDKEIINLFRRKYGQVVSEIKMKDLSEEQSDYLTAVTYLVEHPDQPILTRNESDIQNEFNYALETFLSDTMGMKPTTETESLLIEICKTYQIDENGMIKELTADIITDISNQFFALEQKNHYHSEE